MIHLKYLIQNKNMEDFGYTFFAVSGLLLLMVGVFHYDKISATLGPLGTFILDDNNVPFEGVVSNIDV